MKALLNKRDERGKNCYQYDKYNIHATGFEMFNEIYAQFRKQADNHVKRKGYVDVGEDFVWAVWFFKFEEVIDKKHQEKQRDDYRGVQKKAVGFVVEAAIGRESRL